MSPEEATFFFKVFFCNLLKVAADWTGRPEMLILRLGGEEPFAEAGFVTRSGSRGL